MDLNFPKAEGVINESEVYSIEPVEIISTLLDRPISKGHTLEAFVNDFRELVEHVREKRPELNEAPLWDAFHFAFEQHSGQLRKDGSPYFTHLIETAKIVTELIHDPISVQAALLHDIIEDPKVPVEVLEERFGKQVAMIVDGVTKINELSFVNLEERQAANLRKMVLAMSRDPRVILIKLSDRLHNMLTIESISDKRRREIAKETIEIYAPLAHRLGIWWMKWRLEDLCFKVLDVDSYTAVKAQVAEKREQREELLEQTISKISERLREHKINSTIQGRAKHFYSIFRKMQSQGRSFEDILDLLALRIVVATVDDCYMALGHVHALFRPLAEYFNDHIASPKSNGYRSIHTKVIGPSGHVLEVQIRTREMHDQAELGLASHWRYKEFGNWDSLDSELSTWMRGLIQAQQENPELDDFLHVLKTDLQPKDIYVISPRGDVYRIPKGSVVLDFAFQIHSDIGLKAIGAKVNGKMVNVLEELPNGATVEIIASEESKPSAEWLTAVKTNRARNAIKKYFQEVKFDESLKLGKEILDREIERISLKLEESDISTLANQLGYDDSSSFYAEIGRGQLPISTVLRRLAPREPSQENWLTRIIRRIPKPNLPGTSTPPGVRVTSNERTMLSVASCCSPLPGDRIRGLLTEGRGIEVHRVNCHVILEAKRKQTQLLDVEWNVDPEAVFEVRLKLIADDRKGMLHDITSRITQFDLNILSLSMEIKDGTAVGLIKLSVKSLSQLSQLIGRMISVPGVLRVERMQDDSEPLKTK